MTLTTRQNQSPMSASPVLLVGRVPQWLRRCSLVRLPMNPFELDRDVIRPLIDHPGETIINGRRAFVSEPYARGYVETLHEAREFAESAGVDFRFGCKTWHGYGTIRFAWLAPRSVPIPKYLAKFVAERSALAKLAFRLIKEIPHPHGNDSRKLFFRSFWSQSPHSLSSSDAHYFRSDLDSFLSWHGLRAALA